MSERERDEAGGIVHERARERAGVFIPVVKTPTREDADGELLPRRAGDERLAEAEGLAAAIDLDIVASAIVPVAKARPATLIGAGKVDEIKALVEELRIGLAIIDHALTPVQQRNLEKELGCKVIDRTGLILEIFGRRARTKEGRLQVELAHLNYQRGRLVRSWTHLERQRGGGGFMGGPGETQIEADRRQLQDKISRLEKELEAVRRTRTLHRAKRKKAPHPVIALVGYTNAGKSTLFNTVTGADVLAQDLLFATLDPTLRRVTLPHGTQVIFSDTVGFISDLPTHLVAAFRATLEEVIEADIVLHVRDVSDADSPAQSADVRRILADLEVDADDREHVLEIWNKIDLLDADELALLDTRAGAQSAEAGVFPVSALSGQGIAPLLDELERRIAGRADTAVLEIPADSQPLTSWLYEHAKVREREDLESGAVLLTVELTSQARDELRRVAERYPDVSIG